MGQSWSAERGAGLEPCGPELGLQHHEIVDVDELAGEDIAELLP